MPTFRRPVVALAVVLAGLLLAAPISSAAAPPTARVWITTPDGTQKLAPGAPATFRPAARTR